ncbi:hypothetical protein [Nocardia brevicatena]|uniref:hypothetical protein n=1 Tax=Nocardia brevicatena TaxID=37327 RepID=UPI0002D3543B|nr:hypothetical protein [Nocardia brevicatena]
MDAEYASLGDELRARQEEYRRNQQNSESGGWSSTGMTGVTPANGSTGRPEFISDNNYAWTPAPTFTTPPPGPPQQTNGSYSSGTFGSYPSGTFSGQNGTYSSGTPHTPNGSNPAGSSNTGNGTYPSGSFNVQNGSYTSGSFNGLISPEGFTDSGGDAGGTSPSGNESYTTGIFDGPSSPNTVGFTDLSATGGSVPSPATSDSAATMVVNAPNSSKFTAPPQRPDSHSSVPVQPTPPGPPALPASPSAYAAPATQDDDSQPITAVLPKTGSLPALPTRSSATRASSRPAAQPTMAGRPTTSTSASSAGTAASRDDRFPETAAPATSAPEAPGPRTPAPDTPAIQETPSREPRSAEALASLLAEQLALAERLSSAASRETSAAASLSRQTPEPEAHPAHSSNGRVPGIPSTTSAPAPSRSAVPRLPAPDADIAASTATQPSDHSGWFSTISDENTAPPSPPSDEAGEPAPHTTDRPESSEELYGPIRDEAHNTAPPVFEAPPAATRSERRRNGSSEFRPRALTEFHAALAPAAPTEPPAGAPDSRAAAPAPADTASRRSRRRSADNNSEINIHLIMQLLLAGDELHDVATRAEAGDASIEEFIHTARQARDASLAVVSAWYGGTDRMVKFAQSLLHAAGESD